MRRVAALGPDDGWRMNRPGIWALAWGLLLACAPRLATAQEKARASPLYVSLEYEAPDHCLSTQEFSAIVKKRLGRDPFADTAPDRVSAIVSEIGDVLSGDLVWRDQRGKSTGQQHFPSSTHHCSQLIEAMAFALAVQIQLLETEAAAKEESVSPEVARAPTPAASTPPEKSKPAPPEPPSPPDQSNHSSSPKGPGRAGTWLLGAGGGLAFGMSSRVVPTARFFVGLRWTALALEFGLEGGAPTITRREDGAGFSQWHLLSSAAGCALFEPLSVCALLKVGTVQVSGRDVDVANDTAGALAQSGLRLALGRQLSSRTLLSLRADGLVNLTRWSVALDQLQVWRAPPLAFDAGLDFAVFFQ